MGGARRPGLVDRLLRLISDVRAGESGTVLLLTLNVFLILTAYYFIKPIREALILGSGGAEIKSYSSAGQVLLFLGLVPLYGALAGRLPRRKLINSVTLFFVACLVAFFLVTRVDSSSILLGIVFFLWVGIFNLMVIAQFWAFANDLYTREEGERLFPIVAVGASAGGVFGGWATANVIPVFGVQPPLLIAAALLLLSLVVTNYVDARERRRREAGWPSALTTATMPAASSQFSLADIRKAIEEYDAQEAERQRRGESPEREREPDRGAEGGMPDLTQTWQFAGKGEGPFRLVFKCRYLLLIALLMLLLNWVNTTGEYILGSIVKAEATARAPASGLTEAEFIGTFYSNFFAVVNGLGLLIQLFLVSRIVKYVGVPVALLVLPLIALGGYGLIALAPLLAAVRWVKTGENATDYSLYNTVRNMLFLPCTREQKYKAKQAIDAFFWRAGDMLQAVVVFVGTSVLALQVRQFALFNMVLAGLWLVLAIRIGREYRRLVQSGRPPCVEAGPFGALAR
ncbi:MAG: MFS transporter [Gemmatimonadota bacterium]|nr:MAG: MFS transporter [Gemmatimonadota bacterium]